MKGGNSKETHSDEANSKEPVPTKCAHLKKAVKIPKLKKAAHGLLSKSQICHTCQKKDKKNDSVQSSAADLSSSAESVDQGNVSNSQVASRGSEVGVASDSVELAAETVKSTNVMALADKSLYVCLRCTAIFCHSTGDDDHLHMHAKDKEHSVAMNLDTLEIWCFACTATVKYGPNLNQVAFEAIKVFEKWSSTSQKTPMDKADKSSDQKSRNRSSSGFSSNRNVGKITVNYPGLRNLGNTCFFNSCLQSLSYTRLLQTAFEISNQDSSIVSIKAIQYLDNVPFTQALKDFLTNMRREMQTPNPSTISPERLLRTISQKWEEYSDFDQQDAHELLRRLLDGVREEQLTKGEDGKAINLKEDTVIDSIFGGKLVSIIVCDRCKHIAYTLEDYMDMSIPISKGTDDKRGSIKSFFANMIRPSRSRTPSPSMTRSLSSGSSTQIQQQRSSVTPDITTPSPQQPQNSLSASGVESATDSDVEESGKRSRVSSFSRGLDFLRMGYTPNRRKTNENSPSTPFSPIVDPTGDNAPLKPAESLSDSWFSPFRSGSATPPPLLKTLSANSQVQVQTSPTISLVSPNTTSSVLLDEAKLKHAESLMRDLDITDGTGGDANRSRSAGVTIAKCFAEFMAIDVLDGENAWACDKCYENKYGVPPPSTPDKKGRVFWSSPTEKEEVDPTAVGHVTKPDTTIPSLNRSKIDGDQLSQYEGETKELPEQESPYEAPVAGIDNTNDEKDKGFPRVFSRALKRYLIFSAPQTLVVHLKRFEQIGMSGMKKCQTHVQFDETLDLQPYMAPPDVQLNKKGISVLLNAGMIKSSTLELPALAEAPSTVLENLERENGSSFTIDTTTTPGEVDNTAIDRVHGGQYRLYAVVSHMGSINGGHYVAYVRVQLDWVQSLGNPHEPEQSSQKSGDNNDKSEWIYCSDSEVRISSWEEVARVQAYILFYERLSY